MALVTALSSATTDSYVSEEEFDAHVEIRGVTLTGDPDKEVILRLASVWVDGFADWTGTRVLNTQAREWPRTNSTFRDGSPVPSEDVPSHIKTAQMDATIYEIQNPGTLGGSVILSDVPRTESVNAGGVTTNYRVISDSRLARPIILQCEDILKPLLPTDGKGGFFRAIGGA